MTNTDLEYCLTQNVKSVGIVQGLSQQWGVNSSGVC